MLREWLGRLFPEPELVRTMRKLSAQLHEAEAEWQRARAACEALSERCAVLTGERHDWAQRAAWAGEHASGDLSLEARRIELRITTALNATVLELNLLKSAERSKAETLRVARQHWTGRLEDCERLGYREARLRVPTIATVPVLVEPYLDEDRDAFVARLIDDRRLQLPSSTSPSSSST